MARWLAAKEEALDLYDMLARAEPGLYEETYQRHLAALRREYDLRGDHAASMRLHLHRDDDDADRQ